MYTSTEQVLQGCVASLQNKGASAWLATVVSTWGSSPRAPGSMMLWSPVQGTLGSVSGGCVEEDLLKKIQQAELDSSKPSRLVYGDQPEKEAHLKLPCGGILQLVVEPLNARNLEQWQAMLDCLAERKGVQRCLNMTTGEWSFKPASASKTNIQGEVFSCYLGPTRKLLIIGANQVAWHLSQFARTLEFEITVCDPCEQKAKAWLDAPVRLIQKYPDGLVDREFNDAQSAVVAVSHDPRLDDMALLEALPGKAFYVGSMGSASTSEARRQRLRQLSVPDTAIEKLRAPIGLAIGSKSPAEIALSIAADLISHYQAC